MSGFDSKSYARFFGSANNGSSENNGHNNSFDANNDSAVSSFHFGTSHDASSSPIGFTGSSTMPDSTTTTSPSLMTTSATNDDNKPASPFGRFGFYATEMRSNQENLQPWRPDNQEAAQNGNSLLEHQQVDLVVDQHRLQEAVFNGQATARTRWLSNWRFHGDDEDQPEPPQLNLVSPHDRLLYTGDVRRFSFAQDDERRRMEQLESDWTTAPTPTPSGIGGGA